MHAHRGVISDMKKYYCAIAVIAAAAIAILFAGSAAGIWEISKSEQGLLGLIAILPAVIWIFFKGANLVNIGMYFGGLDYILMKKFLSMNASVVLIVAEAAVIIVCIMITTIKKNKELEAEEKAAQSKAEETNG